MFISHFLIKSVDVRIRRDEWIIEGDDLQTIEIAFKRPISDDFLWEIARQNPDHKIELDKNGKLHVMAPVGFNGGFFEGEAFGELRNWQKRIKHGRTFRPVHRLQTSRRLYPRSRWSLGQRRKNSQTYF